MILAPKTIRGELYVLIATVALPFAGMIGYGVYDGAQRDFDNAGLRAQQLADITAARVERFLLDFRVRLEAVARRPPVQSMDPARCDAALGDLLDLYPRAGNIIVVDRDGWIVCGAKPPPRGERVRIQDFGALHAVIEEGRFAVSHPLIGGISRRWTVTAATPVRGRAGSIVGGVGMGIDLLGWEPFSESPSYPFDSQLGIVDSGGILIARSAEPEKWIGRDVRDIEAMAAIIARKEGVLRAAGAGGTDRLWGFRPIAGTDWIAYAGIPSEQVLGPIRRRVITAALLLLAVVLAVLGVAIWSAYRMARPIRAIAVVARTRAEGDEKIRAAPGGTREIVEVADQFNRMIDAQSRAAREREQLLERLEQQLERMPILCVTYDERLLVSYVNPAAVRTLGWSREEMIGRAPFETFIPPDRRATMERIFARLQAGEYVRAPGEGLCKDGTRILLEWVNTPLHREDGTFMGLMSMAQDVIEKAHAQALIAASERRYRLMFDASPMPMWVIDRATLEFLAVNDAAVMHYGYAREEFLAMTVFDVRPAEDRARVVESARSPQESMQRGARKHLKKGGVAIDVEIASQDIEFAGRAARIVLAHDVTDKLRAERALRDGEERFRALAALSADSFWEQDEQFRYTALSPGGVLERRRVAREGVIGRAPWELPGVESLEGGWDDYRAMLTARRPYRDHRFRVTLPDGTIRYATASGEPRFAADGRFIGYRGVSSDVTARVRAEEALRELNAQLEDRVRQRTAQLEEANRELEAFSYSVSHDLRAPLRHIDGFARRLDKALAGSPESAQRDLGIIRGAAKRMGELIDDLLNLSRTARAPVDMRRVDLGALVRELAGQTPPVLGAAEIRWRIGELPAVSADASLMRIVLQNLISNAVKYSRKRAVAEIEIGALRNADGETVVHVRDNGVGFDMRFGEKLFGVFQRLHREEDFEGTGIGLATVRRILHRHGGRIWAEGEPDKGATFSFTVTVAEDAA